MPAVSPGSITEFANAMLDVRANPTVAAAARQPFVRFILSRAPMMICAQSMPLQGVMPSLCSANQLVRVFWQQQPILRDYLFRVTSRSG
jgi:hypothetical protein